MLRRLPRSVIGAFVAGFMFGQIALGWPGSGPDLSPPPSVAADGGAPAEETACPDAFGRFVGLHDGRVAVFAGRPDGCRVLLSVLPMAGADLPTFQRDDLAGGVVFHRDEELFQILEGLAGP